MGNCSWGGISQVVFHCEAVWLPRTVVHHAPWKVPAHLSVLKWPRAREAPGLEKLDVREDVNPTGSWWNSHWNQKEKALPSTVPLHRFLLTTPSTCQPTQDKHSQGSSMSQSGNEGHTLGSYNGQDKIPELPPKRYGFWALLLILII